MELNVGGPCLSLCGTLVLDIRLPEGVDENNVVEDGLTGFSGDHFNSTCSSFNKPALGACVAWPFLHVT